MKKVFPTVFFVASPEDEGGMMDYLLKHGIAWRPDPQVTFTENLIEFAGRICYRSWEQEDGSFENKNLTKVRTGNDKYLQNVLDSGHGSVFEHGNLVFLFSNVSRVFTHELVRHRAGTAFSQTSGRYVRPDEVSMWMPESLSPLAQAYMEEAIAKIEEVYADMAEVMAVDSLPFSEKKKLTSAMRRILPIGMANDILFSCNHRSLRHIIELRTSIHAEEEIRKMFYNVAMMVKVKFPNIYQDMNVGPEDSITFRNEKV